MRERGTHRDRVRVPRVVDQQPAARQLGLLRAPERELDLHRFRGGSTPSASAAVSAAAAFAAWWRAVKPNTTSRPCQRTCVRPSRTSASGAPKRRTSSPSGTNGSSAGASSGRTATAPAGSSSSSSALASRDVLEAAQLLEMDGRDRRDHAEVRPRDPGEVADLAGAAHRHLRHDHLGLGLDPAQRERQADLVVEAVRRRHGAQVRAQERREDVLRRRLPDRAGDRHDASIAAGADGTTQRGERGVRVVGHERRRGTARAGVVEKRLSAGDGDEQVAGLDPARVDLDAGDRVRVALERLRARAPAPRRAAAGSGPSLQRLQGLLRASRSSNGTVGRELLTLLRALAGDEDDVARPRELDSALDRRSAIELDLDTRRRLPTRSRRRSPPDPRCAGCRR